MRLSCLVGTHQRISRVWWDGFDFCSRCQHCGAPLYKRGNKRWRRLDREREAMFLGYQADKIDLLPDSRASSRDMGKAFSLPVEAHLSDQPVRQRNEGRR